MKHVVMRIGCGVCKSAYTQYYACADIDYGIDTRIYSIKFNYSNKNTQSHFVQEP